MVYKRFFIEIILRVTGLTINSFLIVWAIDRTNDAMVYANLILIMIIQVVFFVRSVNKVNKDIGDFIEALRNNDTSLHFSKLKQKGKYEKVYKELSLVNEKLKTASEKQQEKEQFFEVLAQFVEMGLLAYNENERITLFNKAAKNILHIHRLTDLNQFRDHFPELYQSIVKLPVSQNQIIEFELEGSQVKLLCRSTKIKFRNSIITLVAFQNIKPELDTNEFESWEKLIRVLTHEIMNSVGPISGNIATIRELLTEFEQQIKSGQSINEELISDSVNGLEVVQERSNSLMRFVNDYRSYALIPEPKIKTFSLGQLVHKQLNLMKSQFAKANIDAKALITEENFVLADDDLTAQVIINLLKNATESMSQGGRIQTKINTHNEFVKLSISDEGMGIDHEIRDKIFIPFFTTKEEGSGIGLSLSRQIMRMQGGEILVHNNSPNGSVFTAIFRKA